MPSKPSTHAAPADGPLEAYRKMRDFARTPEPDGATATETPPGDRFVVQEHHATHLHWDFRLEREGVLVSWSVPKGIPEDPRVNHLAVRTEDHPLGYIDFAGAIPEGSYGAGTVTIWDTGTYETHKFRDREVMVTLHGRRVHGKYVLFQTEGKNWMMHRMDPPQDPAREPMPGSVEPMLAKLAGLPRDDAAYAFEVKWDGIRAILFVEGGRVRVQSRNLLDITKQYPELAGIGLALGARTAVLDGEIIAPGDDGAPSFARLQTRMGLTNPNDVRRRMKDVPVAFMAFDVLYLDGHSAMPLPYAERRRLLESLALEGPHWQTPAFHPGDGEAMLASSRERGLEGLVAKRLDSAYEPGRRSTAWLKVKNSLRQEFVVGGWTPGVGGREGTLGALLLGYYDRAPAQDTAGGDGAHLVFAGKVGTGFSDRLLATLLPRLEALRRETSPFNVGVPEPGSLFVEPELVADVDFTEWTQRGTLRHPSFCGLRDDKPAREVVRETVGGELPPAVVGKPGVGRRTRGEVRRPAPAASPAEKVNVEVDGRPLVLSNLEKVLYPAAGFTKAQVIDYYTRIAPVMLPHLRSRPMTLKRYPNGVDQAFFYEKECPSHHPGWVATCAIHSNRNGRPINYCLVQDLPTLIWLANLAALELHPLLARAEDVQCPTSVVFDLDPGAPADVVDCAEVALWVRDLFAGLGLRSFAKTSGSKGMQVYVPLNTPTSYEQTKPFARVVAELLQRQHAGRVVSTMSKAVRPGKVFIDWSQNDEHKTTVAVYSLRARERPAVSAPVTWAEVEHAAAARDPGSLTFETAAVLARVARDGDLFAPMLSLRQELPDLGRAG